MKARINASCWSAAVVLAPPGAEGRLARGVVQHALEWLARAVRTGGEWRDAYGVPRARDECHVFRRLTMAVSHDYKISEKFVPFILRYAPRCLFDLHLLNSLYVIMLMRGNQPEETSTIDFYPVEHQYVWHASLDHMLLKFTKISTCLIPGNTQLGVIPVDPVQAL
jgi:hypothetical protein